MFDRFLHVDYVEFGHQPGVGSLFNTKHPPRSTLALEFQLNETWELIAR